MNPRRERPGSDRLGVSTRRLMVALALGIPTDRSPPVTLRGVTGFATVPTIRVDTLSVGDVAVDSPVLPIVPDAMGGAEGILGYEGLANKRIFIDFRHDRITDRTHQLCPAADDSTLFRGFSHHESSHILEKKDR